MMTTAQRDAALAAAGKAMHFTEAQTAAVLAMGEKGAIAGPQGRFMSASQIGAPGATLYALCQAGYVQEPPLTWQADLLGWTRTYRLTWKGMSALRVIRRYAARAADPATS